MVGIARWKGNENPKICECPFTDWCHEVRQRLQVQFRNDSKRYKSIEQCDFYKLIKEMEEKKNEIK